MIDKNQEDRNRILESLLSPLVGIIFNIDNGDEWSRTKKIIDDWDCFISLFNLLWQILKIIDVELRFGKVRQMFSKVIKWRKETQNKTGKSRPGFVHMPINPVLWETEAERSWVWVHTGQCSKTVSKSKIKRAGSVAQRASATWQICEFESSLPDSEN